MLQKKLGVTFYFIDFEVKLIYSGRQIPAWPQTENKSTKTFMRHLIHISQLMQNLIELGN